MARKPFTFESNVEKVIEKIQEKPFRVMNVVGQNLVREIRATTLKQQYGQRYKMLSRTLGYWARKRERDLQIGFKMSIEANAAGAGPGFIGDMMAKQKDPLKPVVIKNAQLIQEMIAKAIDEINKE